MTEFTMFHRFSTACLLPPIVAVLFAAVSAPAQVVLGSFPYLHPFDRVVLMGDLDADGVRDIGFARRDNSAWYSIGNLDFYSARTGNLILTVPPPAGGAFFALSRVGDLDGDGRDDIGTYHFLGSITSGYHGVVSSATGSFLHSVPEVPWLGGIAPQRMDDITADGRAEIIISRAWSVPNAVDVGRVDIVDGTNLQVLRSHLGIQTNQNLIATGLDPGDVDGDGVMDYLLLDAGQAPNPQYHVHSGATGVLLAMFPFSTIRTVAGIGDFNADGFDDIVFADQIATLQYDALFVMAGPSLTHVLWSNVYQPPSTGPRYIGSTGRLGDLDGDGHAELGTYHSQSQQSRVLAGRDQSTLLSIQTFPPFGPGLYAGMDSPGDANGDGFPDLMIFEDTASAPPILRVFSGAPPGVTLFGSGCQDQTGEIPRIGIGVGARLGRTMTINLSNANPALLAAVLGIGLSNAAWGGAALPLDLGFVGMPGCNWYVSGDVALTLPTVGLNGTRHHATYPIPVPANITLLGLHLYSQWFILEPLGGSTTRAVRTTVVG